MFDETEVAETPMFCDVLRQLHTTRLLPVDAVGDLLSIADPYPLLSTRDLKYGRVRTIFRNCSAVPGVDAVGVQRRILNNLTEGKGWTHQHITGSSIDPDRMEWGHVFAAVAEANQQIAQIILKRPKKSDMSDEILKEAIAAAIQSLMEAQQIVSALETRRSA